PHDVLATVHADLTHSRKSKSSIVLQEIVAGGISASAPPALPDIPAVCDFLPGYEATSWHGIGVAKNTPAEMIDKLNKAINASLVAPKLKARLADLGGTVMTASPADLGKLIADETEKWGKVIRAANIKSE